MICKQNIKLIKHIHEKVERMEMSPTYIWIFAAQNDTAQKKFMRAPWSRRKFAKPKTDICVFWRREP